MAFCHSLDDMQSAGLTQPLQLYKMMLLMPGGISSKDLQAIYVEANVKVNVDFMSLIRQLERRSLVKLSRCAPIDEFNFRCMSEESLKEVKNACFERYEFQTIELRMKEESAKIER